MRTTTILLRIWIAVLFGGLLFGLVFGSGTTQHIPMPCRLGSSLILVAAGWIFYSNLRGSQAERFALCVAMGMTWGTAGDFFNAWDIVLGGIVTFGIGHLFYIAGCFDLGRRAPLTGVLSRWQAIAVWQVIGLIGWAAVVATAGPLGLLHWAGLPYTLLLAGTAGCASSLALQERRLSILALGAALFLISDVILAWGLFHGSFPYVGDLVWVTYGPGQMFIVYSIGPARDVVG